MQDTSEVDKCIAAARSILNGVCEDEADSAVLMDAFLAPRKGWPQYMMPSMPVEGKEASGAELEASSSSSGVPPKGSHEGDPEAQGQFVPAFALALGEELGFGTVLQPSHGESRCAHTLVECFWLMHLLHVYIVRARPVLHKVI